MASSADEAAEKLRADPEMVKQFREAYGRDPDAATLLNAIATYERTIVSGWAPFDRWIEGEESAISEAAKRGFALFNGSANATRRQALVPLHEIFAGRDQRRLLPDALSIL